MEIIIVATVRSHHADNKNHNQPNQNTIMKVQFKKAAKKGFSLVELLVVIAVIGIMAAIAIPMISNINEKSKDAKNRRNAQSIASMATSATAAGAQTAETGGAALSAANVLSTITGTGAVGVDGSFKGTVFRVPGLSTTDITEANDYLYWQDGNVVYAPAKKPATMPTGASALTVP